jgi:hypothetical protein
MSQTHAPVYVQQPPGNSLGVAGFICSLVGLVSCGLLSPVGLVLSAAGLRREPKGLAIAGLVLGIIGSIWFVLALVFGLFGLILAAVGLGVAAPFIDSAIELESLDTSVRARYHQSGAYPATLSELTGLDQDALTDAWGSPYRYTLAADSASFSLTSDGPDKTPGTSDDLSTDEAQTTGTQPR